MRGSGAHSSQGKDNKCRCICRKIRKKPPQRSRSYRKEDNEVYRNGVGYEGVCAVQRLRLLVCGLIPRRAKFYPRPVRVEFLVDKDA
jgi:hypothetical protein